MNRTRIHIKGGQIISGSENLKRMIRHSKDGDFAVEKKVWSGAKTWEQVKTVKGVVIPSISEYTGETRKEVERRLKKDYGQSEYFEQDGETCLELKSFSGYTKAELRNFIEGVLQHCEEDLEFIIDLKTRKKLEFNSETAELTEIK